MGNPYFQDGKMLMRGGLPAMSEACCCTPPVYLCAGCDIVYGTFEAYTWAGFFNNNLELPESETIHSTVVNRVVVEIVADVDDLLSTALVCHCTPQDFDCSLVCSGGFDLPSFLYALFCDHEIYKGEFPFATWICGGVCASNGPNISYPSDPGGALDGDPCIYDEQTGLGSRPGICHQEDHTIEIPDQCCKKFKKAWELLLGGDDGVGDTYPPPEGTPNDGDVGSHENCTWQVVAYNLCNFDDIHYDQFYDSDVEIQECQIHGGQINIIAFVTRNWYTGAGMVAPSDDLYWWVILAITANNMRQYALYQSGILPTITDVNDVECAKSVGIFEMTKVAERYFNDVYNFDPYIVKTCNFPDHLFLTATNVP